MARLEVESQSVDLDVWRLLPWLANGTLEGPELECVLDHLKTSERCREELLFLSELRSAVETANEDRLEVREERLSGLMKRIDIHELQQGTQQGTSSAGRITAHWMARAAAVALLAAALWWWNSAGGPGDMPGRSAQFQTLSADRAVAPVEDSVAAGPWLRLIPAPGMTEEELRHLVLELDAEIVAGRPPSASTPWVGRECPKPSTGRGQLGEMAAELRGDRRVALVEPVWDL